MLMTRPWKLACLAGAAAVLGGCVAEAPLSVAPGQGKNYTDLQRDDAACRAAPAPVTGATTSTAAASATTAAGGNYFQCMQARGELVVATRTVAYPAYAGGYPYSPYGYAYPYGYGYPYGGYPYYGYPYSAAYFGPYVGLGLGFGFGGYYGRDFDHGFYRGGYRGFDHGGFHDGGGFHGGGFHR